MNPHALSIVVYRPGIYTSFQAEVKESSRLLAVEALFSIKERSLNGAVGDIVFDSKCEPEELDLLLG